jgi:hypothetical protein
MTWIYTYGFSVSTTQRQDGEVGDLTAITAQFVQTIRQKEEVPVCTLMKRTKVSRLDSVRMHSGREYCDVSGLQKD